MIQFNFAPEQLRKERGSFLSRGLGGVPAEVFVGILLMTFGALFLVHVILGGIFLVQFGRYQVLQFKWNTMGTDKKVFEDIANESKGIQNRLNTVRPITSQMSFRWSRLFNDISDNVPKGVWLRQIDFNKGILTITGSSVSKMANEMVTVGSFTSALNGKSCAKTFFTNVEVDFIQRRVGTTLSIADFKLKTRQK